jgi:hypothetical protein
MLEGKFKGGIMEQKRIFFKERRKFGFGTVSFLGGLIVVSPLMLIL